MREKTIERGEESRAEWETLEAFARQGVQRLLQRVLEEEVDELLGRGRYERQTAVDAVPGHRNGFGKPRRLSLSNGTITLRRPRVRGLNERFESRLLPAFKRRTEEVGRLLPELYLHGLAQGAFDLALRGLLGEGAPLSAPSIARLKAGWQAEYEFWKSRSVADLEVVYFWVDGVYVKAGLEKDKAAMLVVLAALRDGEKVILAVESGYRESTRSAHRSTPPRGRRPFFDFGVLPVIVRFEGRATTYCWSVGYVVRAVLIDLRICWTRPSVRFPGNHFACRPTTTPSASVAKASTPPSPPAPWSTYSSTWSPYRVARQITYIGGD